MIIKTRHLNIVKYRYFDWELWIVPRPQSPNKKNPIVWNMILHITPSKFKKLKRYNPFFYYHKKPPKNFNKFAQVRSKVLKSLLTYKISQLYNFSTYKISKLYRNSINRFLLYIYYDYFVFIRIHFHKNEYAVHVYIGKHNLHRKLKLLKYWGQNLC